MGMSLCLDSFGFFAPWILFQEILWSYKLYRSKTAGQDYAKIILFWSKSFAALWPEIICIVNDCPVIVITQYRCVYTKEVYGMVVTRRNTLLNQVVRSWAVVSYGISFTLRCWSLMTLLVSSVSVSCPRSCSVGLMKKGDLLGGKKKSVEV